MTHSPSASWREWKNGSGLRDFSSTPYWKDIHPLFFVFGSFASTGVTSFNNDSTPQDTHPIQTILHFVFICLYNSCL